MFLEIGIQSLSQDSVLFVGNIMIKENVIMVKSGKLNSSANANKAITMSVFV